MASTKSINEQRKWLTESSIGFFQRAINELESEQPEYSILFFATGVELLLKSRLMAEHWSLIIKNVNNAKWDNLITGDFDSVNLSELINRLKNITTESSYPNFYSVVDEFAKNRNKILHFFHSDLKTNNLKFKSEVYRKQLKVWYLLYKVLGSEWKSFFKIHLGDFFKLDSIMRANHKYLQFIYDEVVEYIESDKNSGNVYINCPACEFTALKEKEVLKDSNKDFKIARVSSNCLVCQYSAAVIRLNCPLCGELTDWDYDNPCCTIQKCKKEFNVRNISNKLFFPIDDPDDNSYADACSDCEISDSVIPLDSYFLCLRCLNYEQYLQACEWCGFDQLGLDEEQSMATGCFMCEGGIAHALAKDDF